MIIIIVLKLNPEVNPWQRQGHWSRLELTWFSVRIKVIIILVLKSDSDINLRQDTSHKWSWLLTKVNLKTKIVIIIVLKLIKGRPDVRSGYVLGGST
jgi:hypothetical protein